ncbi:hypothetical protein HOC80_00595 [archaeon]|jgi:hypothetical protein|nr:hypothetical protein [archaeon]MBT4416584.1 hypothetical protein [archaeon]
MVKVYCLGSSISGDELALQFVGKRISGFDFVKYSGEVCEEMVVMDVVKGVSEIVVLGLDEFLARNPVTVHDFDYGTELRLRMAVGEIKEVKVICLPFGWSYDQVCDGLKNKTYIK